MRQSTETKIQSLCGLFTHVLREAQFKIIWMYDKGNVKPHSLSRDTDLYFDSFLTLGEKKLWGMWCHLRRRDREVTTSWSPAGQSQLLMLTWTVSITPHLLLVFLVGSLFFDARSEVVKCPSALEKQLPLQVVCSWTGLRFQPVLKQTKHSFHFTCCV